MAVGKMRKGKRKFERKMKRYKLCREEMEVTEEPKIVKLLQIKIINLGSYPLRCRLFSST